MRSKLGTLSMVLGAVLVLAALSLFLWNRWDAQRAADSVAEILPQLVEEIEQEEQETDQDNERYDDLLMTEVVIDGYAYIGYLTIPKLGLELPVMSEWDYPRLRIAPCRYSGSTKTNDLVIAAHNYERHFGLIYTLEAGDLVYFTDMDGVITSYTVAEVEILQPTDVEEMTLGDYALTLFTCTYGGKTRVTVRCDRA